MKRFIFDDMTRRCIGCVEGSIDGYNGQGLLVDADSISPDVSTDDMTSLYLSDDGVTVIQDSTALLAQAKSSRKARIKAEIDLAEARGVFGSPFFIVEGEAFWGNDRLAQLERWLEKGPF